jgi:hypothetical protein
MQLTVNQILEDLQNGLTRTPSDKRYTEEKGSIMEKYNLTKYEVDMLFKHPKLKGRKTKTPKQVTFTLIDDTTEETTQPVVEDVDETHVEEVFSETTVETDTENRNVETATNNVVAEETNLGW